VTKWANNNTEGKQFNSFFNYALIIHHPLTLSLQAENLFLQILPTAAFLFFFGTDYTVSRDCLPILLSISAFLLFTFSSVFHFSVVGSVRSIKLPHVGF